ncbi:MAG TPA: hypothetical protein VGG75_05700 [Trebonia sp.]|jgi:hypothetical protein
MPFSNPIIGGGGALVYPSIHSPDYAAGSAGWSINKDGSAEFNDLELRGTFQGTDYVINSAGAFFYSGTPAAGNLLISITSADGTDPYGNPYLGGIYTRSASGAYVQIQVGATSEISLSTGDADEGETGGWLASVPGAGPTRDLGLYGQSPVFAGQTALSFCELYSGSQDATKMPTASIGASNDSGAQYAQWTAQAGPTPYAALQTHLALLLATVSGETLMTAPQAAIQPGTTDTPETWHTITPAGSWTVVNPLQYKLCTDKTVRLRGELTATAAIASGATLMTLPAGYVPTTEARLTWNYNTSAPAVTTMLADVSTAGVIKTYAGIPSGATLNISGGIPLD